MRRLNDRELTMNTSKSARARRRNILVNILHAICILTFVACIALDPQLHELDPSAAPQAKTSDVR